MWASLVYSERRFMFFSDSQVQCIVEKKTEQDSAFWIRFSYSGIVNYSEMPIPTIKAGQKNARNLKKLSLEVMTIFFWKISPKSTNFEVLNLGLEFQVSIAVSEFFVKSRTRSPLHHWKDIILNCCHVWKAFRSPSFPCSLWFIIWVES